MKRKPWGYWTKERCQEKAALCSTRGEFQITFGSAYSAAQRGDFLDEICIHMPRLIRQIWDLEKLMMTAKPFKSRIAFQRENRRAYQAAQSRGLLDIVCEKMEKQGSLFWRIIYAFEFTDKKSVYVGLTCNTNKRYHEHVSKDGRGTVNEYIKENSEVNFEFKILSDFIDKGEAAELEAKTIDRYRNSGWTILNKAKAGGLGGTFIKWDLELCKSEALRYQTRGAFKKGSKRAYDVARKHVWYEQITQHMIYINKPKGFWSFENCLAVAKTCVSRSKFKRKYEGAYDAAWKSGWLELCCQHMSKRTQCIKQK